MDFWFPILPCQWGRCGCTRSWEGTADPNWPKGYSISSDVMLNHKNWGYIHCFVLNDNLFLLLLFQIFLPSTADKEWETEQKLSCHLETTHHNHKFKDCKQRKKVIKKKKEKIQSFFWCLLWYLNNFHECERRSYKVLVCLCDVKDAEYWRNISTLCPCWKETVLDNKSQTQ